MIFFFIWLDGAYGRELKRKEIAYKKKKKEGGIEVDKITNSVAENKKEKKIQATLKSPAVKKVKKSKKSKKKNSKNKKDD